MTQRAARSEPEPVPAKAAAKAASKRKAAEDAAAAEAASNASLPSKAQRQSEPTHDDSDATGNPSPLNGTIAVTLDATPHVASVGEVAQADVLQGGGGGGGGGDVLAPRPKKGKEAKGGSAFKGVYLDKTVANKWKSSIRLNQREVHLGYYSSEAEAARAYDKACICIKGEPKNLTRADFTEDEIAKLKALEGDLETLRKNMGVGVMNSSSHRGVCLEKKTKKWRAEIQINGKKESLGYHKEEDAAVRTYDRALIVLKGERARTNHPLVEYESEMEHLKKMTFLEFQGTLNTKARRHASWTSKHRGVRRHEHKQKHGTVSVKWRAEITLNGKKQSLGYHDTEEKAARAYDDAVRRHAGMNNRWLNFPDAAERSGGALLLPAPKEQADAPPEGAEVAVVAVAGTAATKSVGGVKERKVAAAAAAAAKDNDGPSPEGGFLASLGED